MFEGRLVAICIADDKCAPLRVVEEVEAVPGRGLIGDRYFARQGTFWKGDSPDREVTLIEIEAVEALAGECQITIAPESARRNLVTQGVPLNHLVGREFAIGGVRLRGIRLCEPCGHLQKLTVAGIKDGLTHRGGLRAQVLTAGVLRRADPIRLVAAASVPAPS
jgi:MOSC domain-containing protein YiiM